MHKNAQQQKNKKISQTVQIRKTTRPLSIGIKSHNNTQRLSTNQATKKDN